MSLKLNKSKWTLVKFGDIVFEPKENINKNSINSIKHVVGLEHIDSGSVHLRRSASPEISTSFTKTFSRGDVLFGRRRAYLKKAALTEFDGICSGDITVLRAKESLLPELLPFIVQNDKFFDYAMKHSAGGLSPRVKFKDLINYELLLPPKDQQKKIAELLWAMDEVIEKDLKALEKIEVLYITKIEKDIIDNNSNKICLKSLGNVIRGVGYKPEDLLEDYSEDCTIILRANNIANSRLNYDSVKILSKTKVKDDQILLNNDHVICMSNGSKELVGKSALYREYEKIVSVGSFCSIFRPNTDEKAVLLEHLFASLSYRRAIMSLLSGSTINNLKPSDIESMSFRINNDPKDIRKSLNELNLIVKNKFDMLKAVECTKSLQKSLINQIF